MMEVSSKEEEHPRIKKVIIADEESQNQILPKRPEPEFKGKTPIIEHGRILLQNDQVFMCDEPNCNAFFGNANSLSHHRRKHRDPRTKCDICKMLFKKQEEKSTHLKTFHPNLEEDPGANPLRCQKCKKITNSAFALKRHIGRTHQTRKYPCPHCGFQYTQIEGLNQHLKHKHLEKGQERPKYPCHVCGKIYLYSPDLRKHLQKAHRPKTERYKCVICKTIYYCKDVYRNHMLGHTKPPKYFCEVCNFQIHTLALYDRHVATDKHKNAVNNVSLGNIRSRGTRTIRKTLKELNCMEKEELLKFCWTRVPKIVLTRVDSKEMFLHTTPVGRKTLEELKQMDKHELVDFCKQRLPKIILHRVDYTKNRTAIAKPKNRLRLKRKLEENFDDERENLNREEKKSMKCIDCEKPFFDLLELKLHEKTCHIQKRYGTIVGSKIVCPVCSKEFKRPHQLAAHAICHSNERPLKCQYCDARFKRKECLTSHQKHVHFGFAREVSVQGRVFTCNHAGCGKQFTRRRTLKRHILCNHLGKRYPCTKCDKDFSRTDYLKNHYEREHADELILYTCKPCNKTFKHRRYFLIHSHKARHKRKMKAALTGNKGKLKKTEPKKKRKTSKKSMAKYCEDSDSDSVDSLGGMSDITDKSLD